MATKSTFLRAAAGAPQKRRWCRLSVVVLAAVLVACALTRRGAEPPFADVVPRAEDCAPIEVSLRALERASRMQSPPATPQSPPLLGLTDISGYRWERGVQDLVLLGEHCAGATPLRLDTFVIALRAAQTHKAVAMTLLPNDPADSESAQEVRAYPDSLVDTAFLELLIQADAAIKEQAFEYVAQRYEDDAVCGREVPAATAARVFFLPGQPSVDVDKAPGRVTVQIRVAPVILKPEQDLVVEGRVQRASLPAGDPLADFATHVTEHFAAIARRDHPYRAMHNAYKLFLLARVLHADKRRPYDLHYWLTEYRLLPNPTQRTIAAIEPFRVTRNCWGRPYAPNEYTAAAITRQLWGGILIGYSPSGEASESLDGLPGLGASLGLEAVTSVTSAPLFLPEVRVPTQLFGGDVTGFGFGGSTPISGIPPGLPSTPSCTQLGGQQTLCQ